MLFRRVLTILLSSTLFGATFCQKSIIRTERTTGSNRKSSTSPGSGRANQVENSPRPCWSLSRSDHGCLDNNEAFCTEWSTGGLEQGRCYCCYQRGLHCPLWICHPSEIEPGFNAHDQCTTTSGNTTRCRCFNPSPKKNYCEEWYCTDPDTKGDPQYEYYSCLEANTTDGVCLLWKEDIPANEDGEPSICQCEGKGNGFCNKWNCKKRRSVDCPEDEERSHLMFWTIAGGGGLLFFGVGVTLAFIDETLKHWYYTGGLVFGVMWFVAVFVWGAIQVWPYFMAAWVVTIFVPCLLTKIRSGLQRKNSTYQRMENGKEALPQDETEMAQIN